MLIIKTGPMVKSSTGCARRFELLDERGDRVNSIPGSVRSERPKSSLHRSTKKPTPWPTLGTDPHPDLYHRLADLREHMGRPDEAAAWHRHVLKDQPDDLVSLAAVKRLGEGRRLSRLDLQVERDGWSLRSP